MTDPLRGFADNGIPNYGAAQTQVDTGELGNRLLRISPIDGKGRVVFYDDFSQGIHGWATLGGTTPDKFPEVRSYDDTNAIYALVPPNYCSLAPGVSPHTAKIAKTIICANLNRFGVEFAFMIGTGGDALIRLNCYIYTGASYFSASYQFNPSNGQSTLEGSLIDTLVSYTNQSLWIPVKLVGDILTGLYDHVCIGSRVIDVSALAIGTFGSSLAQGTTQVFAEVAGQTANVPTGIGYVILTRDEP